MASTLSGSDLGAAATVSAPELSGPSSEDVGILHARATQVLNTLQQRGMRLDATRASPRFSITRAAELVGRTPAALRQAEQEKRVPAIDRGENGRRIGYTLAELNTMRGVFGTRPTREMGDPVAILAVQNFKGGVGKSTVSSHLAQYLAIHGYRVLLIDCDSQGSATNLLGYVPDLDIREEDTLYPFLRNTEMTSLGYAVRDTHWNGLSLIPANLHLYSAEYELAARMAKGQSSLLDRLAFGIASVSSEFDVVILDPPPALGAISLAVMRAANALLVPVPPTLVDFTSTTSFLAMLQDTMAALARNGTPVMLNWLRLLATRVDDNKSIHLELLAMMRAVFGESLMRATLRDSAEIDNASARMMSVYELTQAVTSRETHLRCLKYLDAVNAEIEILIRRTWPSHERQLRLNGLF